MPDELHQTSEDNTSQWEPLLSRLAQHREAARAMGGAERVAGRRASGRLNCRERIERLFDPASFVEIGLLAGSRSERAVPAEAFVAGRGLVGGRPALAGCEDFTVKGGSIGGTGADKRYRLAQLALQERVPLVLMLEGAGHRPDDSVTGRRPNDLQGLAELSGKVPTVCLVLGPSAGHGALSALLCDFVVMTEQASMFAAGPPLVEAAVGEQVTKEELGGAAIHLQVSGVAHNGAADDDDAIELARRYLGYFPLNAWDRAERVLEGDTAPRRIEEMLALVPPDPRKPYSMRKLIELACDGGSVLEVQPGYGPAMVTALARLGGHSVAVVANDPSVMAGTIDSPAAEKATHFMEVAGAYHLPVVFLADNPGVMAGREAERQGVLRRASRMFMAQHRLTVPKLHVTVRKAFGFGSSVMAMNPFDGQTASLAFPGITLGAMPADGGGRAAKLAEGSRERLEADQASSALRSASSLSYDDIIDPRDMRNELIAALELSQGRSTSSASPVSHAGILP